jgi:4'-phosphopantetheinyl transferase
MIRLHLFDLDDPPAPVPSLRGVLDRDEVTRADRFRRPLDRDRYIAGRAILRTLLGDAVGTPAADIRLAYGPHGKPEFADAGPGRPTFGVTHTENLFAVALRPAGSVPVGVDAEGVRPVASPRGVAERVFTPAEVADVVPTALAGDWSVFHRYWTAKEAVLKALGTGFSLDPRAVRLRPRGDDVFGVEPAADSIPGLPERGVWISVSGPPTSRHDGAAIVAVAPVEAHESLEVRPIAGRAPTSRDPEPRDPYRTAE